MSRSRIEPLGVPGAESSHAGGEARARAPAPGAFERWLAARLHERLREGPVRIELWDAPAKPASDGKIRVRVADRGALWQLLVNPQLNFGDLYSAGRLEVHGSLLELLEWVYQNFGRAHPGEGWLARGRRLAAPSLSQSRRNIHHHYDIGNEFYELWLDREALQYTCAYYPSADMTIEQAQQAKMHHVCRKLRLRSDETVVEAGGGWGGFALFMARNYGAKVRSFNISREQVAYARAWAKRAGLENRVEFIEDDFRNITGQYHVFVSIGMLEHVGAGNYETLGKLMSRSITLEGRGLVHSIGRDRPAPLNAWIDKRIFPGAYPPTLREMMDLFEPSGLSVLDAENIRLHYARTLEAWLERYEQNVDQVRSMFDEAFVRAWRLYLTGSMAAFTRGTLQLFQVLFARSGMNNVPATRAHVYAPED